MTPDEIRQSRSAMVSAIADAGGQVAGNGDCRCPFHEDRHPSASIKLLEKGHWHFQCFATCQWGGDVYDVIMRRYACDFVKAKEIAAGLVGSVSSEPVQPKKPPRSYPSPRAAADSYAKWKGGEVANLYEWSPDWVRARIALTAGGKTFVEITRNGAGWITKAPPGPHCLYRVAELPAAGPIVVVEGEKAADVAWSIDIPATTSGSSSSAGSADWTPLRGRDVAILPDNDPPGAKYAEDVAAILCGIGCRGKIVALPGLPEAGDIVEFVEARR